MSSNLDTILVGDYIKEYPAMFQIYIYHNDYVNTVKNSVTKKLIKHDKNEASIQRSVRRSRCVISDIIACNQFELWTTFTFDRMKHDRYDINHCKTVMQLWLNRQSRRSNDFQYLIVPELHKDGALHFHALLNGYKGTLRPTKARTKKNNLVVHKLTGYRAGNAQAVKIDGNYDAIIGYLNKYIKKDMPLLYNKSRYWCSKGLDRPKITCNGIFKFRLQNIIKNYKPDFINSVMERQTHKKGYKIPLTYNSIDKLL